MKVLIVNDYAALTGGAEVNSVALRDGLRQRGHDARLFSSSARPPGSSADPDYECRGTLTRWRTLLQTANPWAYAELRRVLARFQPDVVHVRMFLTQLSPLILPLLRNVPSLCHIVWYRAICPTGLKFLPRGDLCRVSAGWVCCREGCVPLRDWLPLMLQRRLLRRWRGAFDLVVANSRCVADRVRADGIEPVEVVWNGVAERPDRPPLSDPPTVAFAGRLVREKGVDMLLRAFQPVPRRVAGARLLVAGDGPERYRLERLADALGIAGAVAWLGHLPTGALERTLAHAWVQAVPSLWEEPFGNVAAEAMMRGTAVVASRRGGLVEIVEDGATGFLVSPEDTEAFGASLTRLLQDRDLSERLGAMGRQRALRLFNQAAWTDSLVGVYHRIRDSRRQARRRG